jgi:hypothetical protein
MQINDFVKGFFHTRNASEKIIKLAIIRIIADITREFFKKQDLPNKFFLSVLLTMRCASTG